MLIVYQSTVKADMFGWVVKQEFILLSDDDVILFLNEINSVHVYLIMGDDTEIWSIPCLIEPNDLVVYLQRNDLLGEVKLSSSISSTKGSLVPAMTIREEQGELVIPEISGKHQEQVAWQVKVHVLVDIPRHGVFRRLCA